MKNQPRIITDHEIMLGKPVIRGTRIIVELVLRKMASRSSASVTRMHEVSVCDARFKREPLASESQPRTSVGRSQTRSTAA